MDLKVFKLVEYESPCRTRAAKPELIMMVINDIKVTAWTNSLYNI